MTPERRIGWDGQRLTHARHIAGLSQTELAHAMDTHYKCVWAWERNRNEPGSYTLIRLCRALNVSADYLLGLSDTPRSVDTMREGG
jgi:transcriptional regulator with XRE-family HTH domain